MESMLYQGHGFLGGIKHFWMAVRVWKTNLILEDLAPQKRTKIWPKWGISWGLIDVWQSEWSVVCWIWIAKPSTKFWPSNIQKICAKLVPKILTNEQKENRRNVCLDLLERIENDKTFFEHVITVMKRGFWNTILTPNDKVRSGARATHRAQRKQEWANQNHANLFFQQSRPCS